MPNVGESVVLWNIKRKATVYAKDIVFTLEEIDSATTLSALHYLVMVDASGGSITVTLPASASHSKRMYTIKKIDSSGHTVTIDGNGIETIDGELTIALGLQYSYITIVCDGTEWFIIGGEYVKMEDKLDDILETLETQLEHTEKLLVLTGKIEKYQEHETELEVDMEELEEELRGMLVEIED